MQKGYLKPIIFSAIFVTGLIIIMNSINLGRHEVSIL